MQRCRRPTSPLGSLALTAREAWNRLLGGFGVATAPPGDAEQLLTAGSKLNTNHAHILFEYYFKINILMYPPPKKKEKKLYWSRLKLLEKKVKVSPSHDRTSQWTASTLTEDFACFKKAHFFFLRRHSHLESGFALVGLQIQTCRPHPLCTAALRTSSRSGGAAVRKEKSADLFFFECSSFPLFTPKILVIRVLKSRVEEFLTWVAHTNTQREEHTSMKPTFHTRVLCMLLLEGAGEV